MSTLFEKLTRRSDRACAIETQICGGYGSSQVERLEPLFDNVMMIAAGGLTTSAAIQTALASIEEILRRPGISPNQLDQVLDRELLMRLMDELSADDRLNLLMIVESMRTALAMAEIHSKEPLTDNNLAVLREVLSRMNRYLAGFDRELHEVFSGDAGFPELTLQPAPTPPKSPGGNFRAEALETPMMPG